MSAAFCARAKRGEISADALREVQGKCIREAVARDVWGGA